MGQTKRLSTLDQATIFRSEGRARQLAAALSPLDQVAAGMEAKWGCDRLPRLVSTDLASRFAAARRKLDDAIHDNDAEAVSKRADVLARGWHALDTAATSAGHDPMPRDTWSVRHEGQTYTVVLDRRDHDIVSRLSPEPDHVITINELLLAWSQWKPAALTQQVKAQWPGSEARRGRSKGVRFTDDEIPF